MATYADSCTTFETGQPIVGAPIQNTFTDANGAYLLQHVYVGIGAQTVGQYPTYITGGDYTYYAYYEASSGGTYYNNALVQVTLRANETVVAPDIRLMKRRFGTVHGTVRDVASHETLGGSGWTLSTNQDGGMTAGDGTYQSRPVGVPFPGDMPLPVRVYASVGDGTYWPASSPGNILANQNATVDVDLIRVCTGATIVGTVINAATLQPI